MNENFGNRNYIHDRENISSSILSTKIHILVHVVDDVAIVGIVHTRWMFYLELFMKTFKAFVQQKTRPEGSMAEGRLVQELCV